MHWFIFKGNLKILSFKRDFSISHESEIDFLVLNTEMKNHSCCDLEHSLRIIELDLK